VRHLLEQAWALHRRAETDGLPHLVRPSVPILFFGDSRAYESSPLRVITVGLNPSKLEFPAGAPFSRFPAAQALDEQLENGSLESYRRSLDDYFRTDPYNGWFRPSFEPLLSGLGASYYDGAGSTALHTDLCSPLATAPTWSRLGASEQAALIRDGNELWHELVEYLQPDVVLISVKREHLATIRFPIVDAPRHVYTVERDNPYVIELSRRRLAAGKEPAFVFGKAVQTPFGVISAEAKRAAGRAILETIHA
jgi:hypothetical protein